MPGLRRDAPDARGTRLAAMAMTMTMTMTHGATGAGRVYIEREAR
ncbi:hypothetical protein [Burkholderia sp. Se-20373]|nr:hypothetical protein [Burkholderia sp. Se-20373]